MAIQRILVFVGGGIVTVMVLPVVSDFFVELARQLGAYDDPEATVSGFVTYLISMSQMAWYPYGLGFVLGVPMGFFLQYLAIRFDGRRGSKEDDAIGVKLIKADNKWNDEEEYRLRPATVLWFGFEPFSDDDTWTKACAQNRDIRDIFEQLFTTLCGGNDEFKFEKGVDFFLITNPNLREQDGSDSRGFRIMRKALQRYAKHRLEKYNKPIPEFLKDQPQIIAVNHPHQLPLNTESETPPKNHRD